ncbi:hypothetical protein HOY34_20680 [Xinfangfangia sp. D13-10-4-6]|uniref:Rap1a/Tai family immunity protein n=1 Tax=Pseudogemmobacter hezensis TaxID=2737662 RepID=UPI0015546600|nr:Rap1a/Tai family immunity protein [Pseudogemmobacter hezensis]NPD17605.1 hypothetical protein [Pseudogemmobacter hezensis]
MKWKITVFLVALGVSSQANDVAAQNFFNGNDLLMHCQPRSTSVTGYVVGAIDVYRIANAISPHSVFGMCVPKNATAAQVSDVFCKYIIENPAQRHYAAGSLVWTAMNEAWPCPAP